MLPTAVALLYVGGKGGEQPGYGVPEDRQGEEAAVLQCYMEFHPYRVVREDAVVPVAASASGDVAALVVHGPDGAVPEQGRLKAGHPRNGTDGGLRVIPEQAQLAYPEDGGEVAPNP